MSDIKGLKTDGLNPASPAFSPPNPNEVDRIRRYVPARPSPWRSRPGSSAATSGSTTSRLADAGTQPSRMARAQIAASIAPDAPSGWP